MKRLRPFRFYLLLMFWTHCQRRLTLSFGLPSLSLHPSSAGLTIGLWLPVILEWAVLGLGVGSAFAEPPQEVTVQWGGVAFFDHAAPVTGGGTSRLIDMDNVSLDSLRPETTLNDTFGVNLVSITWTKQWNCSFCDNFMTRVTAGAVLIPDDPNRLQTDPHYIMSRTQYRIGGMANGADGMSGLVNKFFSQRNDGPAFGQSLVRNGTTLSKELFERSISRGLAIPIDTRLPESFSLMGRVNLRAQFWSLAYKYEGLKIEAWNQTPYRDPSQSDLGIAVAYSVEWDSTRFWDLKGGQRRATARREQAMLVSNQLK
jgi:hypothetical protein